METVASGGCGVAIAGLIVGDGDGRYYAIAWDTVLAHRVPAAWLAAIEAAVRGAEPADDGDGPRGHVQAPDLPAHHALVVEAVGMAGRLRLAALRLEAWALLRSDPGPACAE